MRTPKIRLFFVLSLTAGACGAGAPSDDDDDVTSDASQPARPATGTLDPTFGEGGILWPGDYCRSFVQDPDGGLVVLCGPGTTTARYTLRRFLENGTVDNSFGNSGIVTGDGVDFVYPFYVRRAANDTYLVIGDCSGGGGLCAVRHRSDGTVDTSFAMGGAFAAPTLRQLPGDTFIDKSGRALVTGIDNAPQASLVRLTDAGMLDPTFAGVGRVVVSEPGALFWDAVALDDGRIFALGGSNSDPVGSSRIFSYLDNGMPNPQFGSAGSALAFDCTISDLFAAPDGRLVAAGNSDALDEAAQLCVFDQQGQFDASFGGNGRLVLPLGVEGGYFTSAAPSVDGRVVAAGYDRSPQTAILIQTLSDGTLDPGFSDDGIVTLDMQSGVRTQWGDVLVDHSGRILVQGLVESDLVTVRTGDIIARYE